MSDSDQCEWMHRPASDQPVFLVLSQDMDMLQRKFILDVVSGCVEQKKLLDVVINAFYGQHVKSVSRGERSQFVGE